MSISSADEDSRPLSRIGFDATRGNERLHGSTTTAVLFSKLQFSCRHDALNALGSLRLHWPEYLMEAGEVSLYLFFACAFATLLQHPASPFRHFVVSGLVRRMLYGLAMGATVIAIVMTAWGKQSGGHFNPAITLTFYRLGNVEFWDALFYAAAQFFGAISGVAIATYVLRGAPKNDAIRYAVTVPGIYGKAGAFVGELTISFILMITVLFVSNRKTLARYTPYFAGALYLVYITFETPLSGMSMNPARTFGSAFHASYWHALWIYFVAPTLGMLATRTSDRSYRGKGLCSFRVCPASQCDCSGRRRDVHGSAALRWRHCAG
jgi:aquaporin Z